MVKLSSEEQKSIQRFCDENNCKPALSVFPHTVNFHKKDTGEKLTKSLVELVNEHRFALKEEADMRLQEKKRIEQAKRYTRNQR